MFTEYEKLLHSDNYVTKRQSLKVWIHILVWITLWFERTFLLYCIYLLLVQLLGELLLDRHNFTVMTSYISRAENLKLMMNLLRDNSRNIQFEAFHVFKVCMPKFVPRFSRYDEVENTTVSLHWRTKKKKDLQARSKCLYFKVKWQEWVYASCDKRKLRGFLWHLNQGVHLFKFM